MLIVLGVAAAAVVVVVGYHQLRNRSPKAGAASLTLVRELAAVVLVCAKAVEGVVKVLGRTGPLPASGMSWGGDSYGSYGRARAFDEEDK